LRSFTRRGGVPVEIGEVQEKLARVRGEVGKVVVGLSEVVDTLLIALLSGGHVLIEGMPGLGKTILSRTFAEAIGGEFKRIQMTPDLLPSDVLGVNVYNQRDGSWALRKGPVFTNILLVDELNRASPKVQSAFLEVMQERQVTLEGQTHPMKVPFMVIATQMPGGAGTYPLSGVQIDRFAYKVAVDYPSAEDEVEVVRRIDQIERSNTDAVWESDDIVELTEASRSVYVSGKVHSYIVNLVSNVRRNRHVRFGPSPRASIWLLKGGRVRALMEGRGYLIPDDVKSLVGEVIGHRVELTPRAEAEEISVDSLIAEALESTPVPKGIEVKEAV
jgi:MoxR-like ATPase